MDMSMKPLNTIWSAMLATRLMPMKITRPAITAVMLRHTSWRCAP
jgi:hypothetical protein